METRGSPISNDSSESISASVLADQSTAVEMTIDPAAPSKKEDDQDLFYQMTAIEATLHATGAANNDRMEIEPLSSGAGDANGEDIEPSSLSSPTAVGISTPTGGRSLEPAKATTAGNNYPPLEISSSLIASAAKVRGKQAGSFTTTTNLLAVGANNAAESAAPRVSFQTNSENDSKPAEQKVDEDVPKEANVVQTIEQLSKKAEDEFRKELAKYNRARDLPQSRYRGVSWDRRMNYWRVKLNAVHIGFFKDEVEGARAYDKAKLAIVNRDTRVLELNFPEEVDPESIPSTVILKKSMTKSELAAIEGSENATAAAATSTGGPRPFNPGRPSIYRGVMWDNGTKCWRAKIKVKSRTWYLGVFREEMDAAKSYDVAALFLMRDRPTLNFPDADYSSFPLSRNPPDFVEEFVREMQQKQEAGTLYKKILTAHNALMESCSSSNNATVGTTSSSSAAATTTNVTTASDVKVDENNSDATCETKARGSVESTVVVSSEATKSNASESELNNDAAGSAPQASGTMFREILNRWSMKAEQPYSAVNSVAVDMNTSKSVQSTTSLPMIGDAHEMQSNTNNSSGQREPMAVATDTVIVDQSRTTINNNTIAQPSAESVVVVVNQQSSVSNTARAVQQQQNRSVVGVDGSQVASTSSTNQVSPVAVPSDNPINHNSDNHATLTSTTAMGRPESHLVGIPPPPIGPKPARSMTDSSPGTVMAYPSMYSAAKDAGLPPPPTFIHHQQLLQHQARQPHPLPPTSHDLARDPKTLGMYGRATLLGQLGASPSVVIHENNNNRPDVEVGPSASLAGGSGANVSNSTAQVDIPTTGPATSFMDKRTRAKELEYKHFKLPLKMIGVKQLGNTGLFRASLDYHSHELFLGDYEFAVDACHAHDLIAVRLFGQYHCRDKDVVNCRPSYIPVLARNEFLIPTSLFRLTSHLVKLCPSVVNEVENNANRLSTRRTEMKEALKSVRETFKRRAYDSNHIPKAALSTAKTIMVDQNNNDSETGNSDNENNTSSFEDSIHLDADEEEEDQKGKKHQKLHSSKNKDDEDEDERILGGPQSLKDQVKRIEEQIQRDFKYKKDSNNKLEISSSQRTKPRSDLLLSFSTLNRDKWQQGTTTSGVTLASSSTTTTTSTDAASSSSFSSMMSMTNSENIASATLAELAKRAVMVASMRKRVKLTSG